MFLKIQRVHLGDEALFARIAKDVFDAEIDIDLLKKYLAQTGNLLVVAIKHGQIVGQCSGIVFHHPDKPTELYIDELGVGVDFRRQGIARKLLDDMLTWARAIDCDTAWLGAEADNVAAQALYRSYNLQTEEPFVMFVFRLNPNVDPGDPPVERGPGYQHHSAFHKDS